ncbi:hypothetical protein GCM10009682_40380 [Luedemannella flava]|uniref:Extracellular solute-binding protein n=1 Tax=Luedemannella flava TaxID=349316 RepID=A0ABP4YFS9_9ACTN
MAVRRRALLCGLAAAALILGGCNSSTGEQQTSGPVSLTMWNTGSDEDTKAIQKAADQYKAAHPDVTIKVETITWADGNAKILAAAQAKQGADIITGGLSWGIQFGALGGMVDLKTLGVVDVAKSVSQQAIWKSITSTDGAVYGAPFDLSAYVLYYNPDLFAKAKIAGPPKTWAELTDAITKLKAAGVKYPFAMEWGNTSWLEYFNFLRQAGGNLYDEGCTKATIDSPQAVEALRFYGELYTKYGAPKDAGFDVTGGMGKGEVAMISGGNWLLSGIPSTVPALKDKLGVAPMPAGAAGGTTFLGGRVIGVMSYSKNQQAAADFITYLYDPAAIKTIADTLAVSGSLFLSSRPDQLAGLQAKPEVVQTLQSIYGTAEGPPACPGWEDSSSLVDKALQKSMFDGVAPESALADAAKIMNDNLKK